MQLTANEARLEIAVPSKRRRGPELEDGALNSDRLWRQWAPPMQDGIRTIPNSVDELLRALGAEIYPHSCGLAAQMSTEKSAGSITKARRDDTGEHRCNCWWLRHKVARDNRSDFLANTLASIPSVEMVCCKDVFGSSSSGESQ